ncbi:hypothetical protein [Microcystis phage Mae-JY30]
MRAKLRWAPPAQTSPTTVNVGKSFWTNVETPFADNEDYVLTLPADGPRTSDIQVFGGRHGRIIGGHMGPGRLLAYDLTGSLFVEGLRWEMTTMSDCIGIRAKTGYTPNWYFQNLNFSGVHGEAAGVHADMIQAHGLIGGTIHVHGVTGDSNYQGFFIPEDFTSLHVEGLKVSCSNFRGNAQPGGIPQPIFLYMQVEETGTRAYPVELSSVWCDPTGDISFSATCKPEGNVSGELMHWPSAAAVIGVVFNGSPPVDFCPATSVGVGYVSPGYVT